MSSLKKAQQLNGIHILNIILKSKSGKTFRYTIGLTLIVPQKVKEKKINKFVKALYAKVKEITVDGRV
jgi:hypothetical protein